MRQLVCIIFFHFISVLFSMNINGFYEGQFGRSYESDAFKWNIWDPNFYLETRINGSPNQNSNYYIKFYPYKDYSETSRPVSVLSESNISFRDEKNGNGFNVTLFTRESQHYWLDGSMLNLINTGIVNNDGNGQGVRFDLWNNSDRSMSYVFSDFSQGGGDDVHLFRFRQSFLKNKINSGMFLLRKNYSTGDLNDYNQVIATDFNIFFGRYYFTTELAISEVPSETIISELNNDYGFDETLKSNVAIKSEIRGIRFGSPKLGYMFFTPGIYSFGNTYRNYMGNNQSNRYGYWLNSYYLVPERAMTMVLNYSYYQKIVPDTITVFIDSLFSKNVLDPVSDLYAEIYIEFINGFKGKLAFNKKDEKWQGQLYKHYDVFSEISVENGFAKLLAQFKVKDIGDTWEKYISGVELSVNLNENWKFFTRGMIANDRVGSRYSMFTEFQYRASGNTELYLQYGPSYWGQYGLVNDDSFASIGSMRKELRLIIKGWF